jgi:hypothetical protein
MTDTQSESGGAVREAMGEAAEKSKETAQQGLEKAKESAGKAKETAAGMLTRQLDERSTIAGERATAFVGAARRVADELRGQGDEETARMTEAAADRADRFAGYLRDANGDAFIRDLEGFARRRPWVAAAGGLMIGLAASRFIKASAERRSLSGNGRGDGGRYADVEAAPAYGRLADVEAPRAPAQHFGHAEGAV